MSDFGFRRNIAIFWVQNVWGTVLASQMLFLVVRVGGALRRDRLGGDAEQAHRRFGGGALAAAPFARGRSRDIRLHGEQVRPAEGAPRATHPIVVDNDRRTYVVTHVRCVHAPRPMHDVQHVTAAVNMHAMAAVLHARAVL